MPRLGSRCGAWACGCSAWRVGADLPRCCGHGPPRHDRLRQSRASAWKPAGDGCGFCCSSSCLNLTIQAARGQEPSAVESRVLCLEVVGQVSRDEVSAVELGVSLLGFTDDCGDCFEV